MNNLNESENKFTQGINPLCVNDYLWTARDEQGSEKEVNEFLYALVRLIKPKIVVETGCYLGDGTLAMAHALKENDYGRVVSCDIEQKRVDVVNERLRKEKLYPEIGVVLKCEGINLIKQAGEQIDFAFIDSGPAKVRGAEIKELLKYLRPLKMFALHDTAPQHQQMRLMSQKIKLAQVYFNTPRGLTLFAN